MAWTINTKKKDVLGDLRMVILSCSADAATQTVSPGLRTVVFHTMSPISMATWTNSTPRVYANSNASGVQSFGVLGCSGFTSGDEFFLVCYGN